MHIVLGFLVAFVIVVLLTRSRAATRACRWREERSGNRGALRKYRCMACGAEAFTSTDGPPDTCRDPNKRG
ncbi:hypothetical protein [Aestuariivita boseongensis]|uniref:hypothetical protein n=1 Tax=Aestuariivita boseongensis TaxID=1470562 RepID=UPI00068060C8|nr:hypothetical protein [Aestuariivita boseongensis]